MGFITFKKESYVAHSEYVTDWLIFIYYVHINP